MSKDLYMTKKRLAKDLSRTKKRTCKGPIQDFKKGLAKDLSKNLKKELANYVSMTREMTYKHI